MAGFVEPAGGRGMVSRFSGTPYHLPNAMSWAAADGTNKNGTAAAEGSYHIRFGAGCAQRSDCVCRRLRGLTPTRRGKHTFTATKDEIMCRRGDPGKQRHGQCTGDADPPETFNAIAAKTTPTN